MSLSKRIHALPLQLANQIAAGEVIERPASVVKELIENSLDAQATSLMIEIEGAGSQLIAVQDNGSGIHPEDLSLAISRHATSKIDSSADLSHISSLGFRGEALPSIQSVSHFSLASRQQDSSCGWQLTGQSHNLVPHAMPVGTRVEVRDLFFNLPARRRFLRSPRTEQQHILGTVQRLALSQFHIAWQCRINGQLKLQLPAASSDADKLKRLGKICGQSFSQHALPVYHAWDSIELSGWISDLNGHRPQTDVQHFFINGRVIRDRLMTHAIRQAFGNLIPDGRQPAYVLYLTLPLEQVDVNVHPTKHEVRFRDARLIHGFISRAILDTLQQSRINKPSSPTRVPGKIREYTADYQKKPLPPLQTSTSVQPEAADSPINLLMLNLIEQRYALVQTHAQTWLLDLVTANEKLQHTHLENALETRTLAARPILVPLRYAATARQRAQLQQYTDLLAQFGIILAVSGTQIQLQQIPSLLIETDKTTFVSQLLESIENQNLTPETLKQLLHAMLPTAQKLTSEHASQLLKNLPPDNWKIQPWARLLDSATLSGLFSEN